jgi:cytochrome c biogenesis protein CcdA
MKKLFTNSNPFILLLIPVLFALIMGISYQFEQKKQNIEASASASVQATSLFVKGVALIKTVCSIGKVATW